MTVLNNVYIVRHGCLSLIMGTRWKVFSNTGSHSLENWRRRWILCKSSHVNHLHNRSREPMAPFERASMTSYSTLMVTMALSARVSKLQPSEICLTSILTSPGHSRSKQMAPFKRASMASYPTLIVTMRLSVTVLNIQPLENTWPNGHIGHRSNHAIMIGTCFF